MPKIVCGNIQIMPKIIHNILLNNQSKLQDSVKSEI